MRTPFADSPEFQCLLRGGTSVDLFMVALEIACDFYPQLDAASCVATVNALADRVRERCPRLDKPREILGQINWVLYVEEKYEGNAEDYYDPRNSFVNKVIERKKGIPISLSLLYQAIARRVGLGLSGVNLPAHFMLRMDSDQETLFVDPFHGGGFLDRAACAERIGSLLRKPISLTDQQFDPCRPDEVVARMLRNLKAIYLQMDDFASALLVQRRLTALRADRPEEQRDLGMLCLQLDRPGEAIDPLEAYLSATPESEHTEHLRSLLRTAKRTVAQWN